MTGVLRFAGGTPAMPAPVPPGDMPPAAAPAGMVYHIDASYFVFRAYHSMPPDMVDGEGNATHALYGFARFLSDLLEQVRPPTMSRIVDGLVEKKLVERVSSESDRRTAQITASAAGRKLLLAGRDRRVRALAKRFQSLNKKEVETLLAAAEIMKRI